MTILPDDVSWLRSRLNIDVATKEFLISPICWPFNKFIIHVGPALAFFTLHSHKATDWLLQFVQKTVSFFCCFLELVDDLSIHYLKFGPFFLLNVRASPFQVINNFSIVKGKCNHGNLNRREIAIHIFKMECGKFRQPLLHFLLDIKFKLNDV